jgi:hypothetical protein
MNNQFFITHSGVRVYPDDLSRLKVNLDDIAHHLTKIQRFGGALEFDQSYSVAQHSIIMATYAHDRVSKEVARACLLHDATEAYIGDVVSPLKAELKDYQLLETELCANIYSKYGILTDIETTEAVKMIDKQILLDEVRCLVPHQIELFQSIYANIVPLGVEIDATLTPYEVKAAFLQLAEYFNIRD